METIKQYLETMFASLPDTPEVRRAKEELLQMMEDKYNELLAEGKSDNEAVGTVIAEFGNLDEIAEELEAIGVSRNDYSLMTSWNFADLSFFTTDLFREVDAV